MRRARSIEVGSNSIQPGPGCRFPNAARTAKSHTDQSGSIPSSLDRSRSSTPRGPSGARAPLASMVDRSRRINSPARQATVAIPSLSAVTLQPLLLGVLLLA